MTKKELLLRAHEACSNGHHSAADMAAWIKDNHPEQYRGIPAFAVEEYWLRAANLFLEETFRRKRVTAQGDLFVRAGVQTETGIWIDMPLVNRAQFLSLLARQERNIEACIREHDTNQRLLDLADSNGWEGAADQPIGNFVSFIDAQDEEAA